MTTPPFIAVVGGGPAGLMAAEILSRSGMAVSVYDRMPSLARKFLMAGRGGLNITHSEPLDRFLARYRPAEPRLLGAVRAFPPAQTVSWCEGLGEPTFVGSSGRVFPSSLKASPLLRAWLRRLESQGVTVALRHRWTGWDDRGRPTFVTADGSVIAPEPAATILALGGASWPRLGADGSWTDALAESGSPVAPLAPSNCGFVAALSDTIRQRHAGQPLKRIAMTFAGETVRGEAVLTTTGIEGGAVYALSAALREAIAAGGEALIHIDLRPDLRLDAVASKLAEPRGKRSFSTHLRRVLRLSPPAIALVREGLRSLAGDIASDPRRLAALIKAVPLRLTAPAPIDRAISSSGGVRFDAIDERFMLRARPGTFVAGEMLDWEAPTGGYLLQGCLATGAAAARGVLSWLAERQPSAAAAPAP